MPLPSPRASRARLLRPSAATLLLLAPLAGAEFDPDTGQWGKDAPEDVRVMSWNVKDTLCSSNAKLEGQNDWTACARIVAALRPDVLVLQECGDNTGNGTGSGVDSVANLLTTLDLFLHGGSDPFNGGAVTAYVQKYAPGYDLPYRFVPSASDGFNRNCVLSRFPFEDHNGDGKSQYSDIPDVSPDAYAPGGDGGIRGFQLVELGLPDGTYAGDLVVGGAHLKAGSGSDDHAQRVEAAQNVAYVVDYWYNGAGAGVPDPNGKIADSPPATAILPPATPVVLCGDWNEEENGGAAGPAAWLSQAQLAGGSDGTDRDRSDALLDDARHPFTDDGDTIGSAKFDYVGWQDSIVAQRNQFLFDTQGTPPALLPPEVAGMSNPSSASNLASDHLPVLVDLELPTTCDVPPAAYCVGAPNSAGSGATMTWLGSWHISQNDLRLVAQGAVPSQFGLFFYGPLPTQVPFGDGFVCVAPGATGLVRLDPPLVTDSFGDGLRPVDFTQPPASAGPGAILPGSTWYFQFWYRDPLGPGGTGFNFSNGLEIGFCP